MQTNNLDDFIQTQLNEPQRQAVQQKDGSILVIAGAGSGKTRVITARIVYLMLHEQVDPSTILALTFTNKAAREMQERIRLFLPYTRELPFIGTFHSYCLRLLKMYQERFHLGNFSILDEDDQTKIIGMLLQRFTLNKRITARQIAYQISIFKNSVIVDDASVENLIQDRFFRDILTAYEAEKRAARCFDFDDLLIETVKLFRRHSEFKASFHEKIRHLLVDEYQDTSHVQHALLKEMTLLVRMDSTTLRSAHHERSTIMNTVRGECSETESNPCERSNNLAIDSLCVVGDEDQSIYSWRGATVDNIVHFKKDFPETNLIKIEQNYRSVQPILDIANQVIQHNTNRNPKKLWSTKKANNRILQLTSFSGSKEGDLVAQYVKSVTKHKLAHQIAVLYRMHFQSRSLEEALIKQSVPYIIVGGIQFYERKEIKDILAYLRLVVNPFDRVSFLRIINYPARHLGKKFEELWYETWNQQPLLDFKQIGTLLRDHCEVTGKKSESLKQFLDIFAPLKASDSPTQAIKHIIEKIDYLAYLKTEFDPQESEAKLQNIQELIRATQHFEEQGTATIDSFLDEVALMQEKIAEQKETQDCVQLMSLHAAKGLEFDHVIITGLEEGLLPSTKSLTSDDAIEEERRLFYVGITRAREYLVLSYSQYRNTYGQTDAQQPSRFLEEVPTTLIQQENCSYFQEHQFQQLFVQFLGARVATPSVMTFGKKQREKETTSDIMINTKPAIVTEWRKNHLASHKTFGLGLIKDIEHKKNGTTIITIQFKAFGIKKIDAKFLQKV